MLFCKNNAVTTDAFFSTYYAHHKIYFDYLKAYHQISLKPEMQHAMMQLISNIPSYDLTDLNVKDLQK